MRWVLGSMFGHMVFFTLVFAVPMAVWLCAELHKVGRLTPINALVMLSLSVAGGLVAAYGMWTTYFKSRRLPPG